MRKKNETTKKIDKLNKKLKRGIAWASAKGLAVRGGAWCGYHAVCPIGAYVAMKHGIEAVVSLQTTCEKFDNATAALQASSYLGLTGDETLEVVHGFDRAYCVPQTPFEALGVRLREKL